MDNENGNLPAFSKEGIFDPNYLGRGSADGFRSNPQTGLTKREYFAGLAMQGLMTSQNQEGEWRHDIKSCAEISVQIADALLAELEKTKNK
jgi:hypothetical protein